MSPWSETIMRNYGLLVVYVGDVGALTLVPYHKGNTEAEYYTENQTTTGHLEFLQNSYTDTKFFQMKFNFFKFTLAAPEQILQNCPQPRNDDSLQWRF